MDALKKLLTTIYSAAYLIVFIATCVSVGFSKNFMMLFNGIFFIIYLLSLWNTGMDTFESPEGYSKKFFIIDMLSIGVYCNIPRLFIVDMSQQDFICMYWVLFALNESICIVWDFVCHNVAREEKKTFHMIWSLLTMFGIFFMIITIIVIRNNIILPKYWEIIDILNVGYQFALLLGWWISEWHFVKKDKLKD